MHWTMIAGWMTPTEGNELQQLALGKRVLEIGSLFGRSTVCMAHVAEHIDAVDPHDTSSLPPGHEWYGLDTYATMLSNLDAHGVLGPKIHVHRACIQDLTLLPNYTFALIDGDHSYAACKRDINIVVSLLVPGSTFAVHDYYSGNADHNGVIKAVDELRAAGYAMRRVKSLAILTQACT